jgi:MFS family permease
MVLTTTILASSLAFVDGSSVNVGLPAIGRSLQGAAADLQGVINAYLLPLNALLLFCGALGDRFGRRNTLILGSRSSPPRPAACAASSLSQVATASRMTRGLCGNEMAHDF